MMPSEAPVLPTQTEKPNHYTYLKEFRTQQCPLFLQHKCTQHRPYTCFHWHFLNQRRRRPVRKRDGCFNYSPDVYCTKYDETTGLCPEGDDCPLLHRTAGDTERRYHLRYYKTGTCVHETDARGHCVKNGPHCAFAHGAPDLRPPVYDIRELQGEITGDQKGLVENSATAQLEKERMLSEDPRWNDTNFVLANYKTEPCKRPPRLCRQGYACPSYHNNRDRRRSPNKFKYRSTPCPNVKHGDDWGDPTQCDSSDACPYCHTRTEQQFHPEIYKSTKCNDMVQTGYCPRGPFCAFAHVEQEMTTQRDVGSASSGNSLAAFVTNALPAKQAESGNGSTDLVPTSLASLNGEIFKGFEPKIGNNGDSVFRTNGEKKKHASGGSDNSQSSTTNNNNHHQLLMGLVEPLGPIGKGRSRSSSGGSMSDFAGGNALYGRAPGSEREDSSKLRSQLQSIEDDINLDPLEKTKRKQNLLLLHNLNVGSICASRSDSNGTGMNAVTSSSVVLGSSPTTTSAMSPHAPSFYPPLDTVESVIGNALDEDLNIGELSLAGLGPEAKDNDNDSNSVCSSLSTSFPTAASSSYFASSVPVTIPSSSAQRNSLGSLSQSPLSSPIGSLPPPFIPQHIQQQQKQEQQLEQAAAAFLSQPNPGKFAAPGLSDFNSMSPGRGTLSQSPLLASSFGNVNGFGEVHRLREELAANKAKLAQWEEGISQARNACDAWKKETEEASRKAKHLDEEKQQIIKQRDEAMTQVNKLKIELELARGGGPFMHCLHRTNELEHLPPQALKQLQVQLRLDLDTLEKIMFQQQAMNVKCVVCREKNRYVMTRPCNHCVMCESCAAKRGDCPLCHVQIQHRSTILMPM